MASLNDTWENLETTVDTVLEKIKLQEEVIDEQNNIIILQHSIIEEKDSEIKLLTEILEKQLSEQNSELQDYPITTPTLQGIMDAHKRTIAEFERTLSPEDAEGLKKVRNDRRTVRALITKTVNKLNAALASEDKIAIKRFMAELTDVQKKLTAKDQDVWALMSDDCVMADQAIGAEWSDSTDNALLSADSFLDGTDPSTAPTPSSSPSSQNNSTKARLPKMDLPKFTGKSPISGMVECV